MTAPYKKRAKAGWNNDKEQSNKDERAYAKRELVELTSEEIRDSRDKEFVDMMDQLSEAPKKPKKKPLKAKDVQNKIVALERKLEFFKKGYVSDWCKGVIARYEQQIKEMKKLHEELKGNK